MTIVKRCGGAIIAALLMHGPGPLAAAGMAIEMGLPFGNEAVLQQQTMTPVWGWTTPAADVTVRFAGQNITTTADGKGKWVARLQPLTADQVTDPTVAPTGHTMTITASKNGATVSAAITGILVG